MSKSSLHAVFASSDEVRDALAILARDGVTADDIEIRSSVPLEHDLVPAGSTLISRVPWIAVLGGFLGGTLAFLLVKLTSEAYPLPTGGMPIVALPTAGVITFEGVAIGAILCTVATVFYECGLPALGRRPGPLDHHVASGNILVTARWTDGDPREWASKALETETTELPGSTRGRWRPFSSQSKT